MIIRSLANSFSSRTKTNLFIKSINLHTSLSAYRFPVVFVTVSFFIFNFSDRILRPIFDGLVYHAVMAGAGGFRGGVGHTLWRIAAE